MGDFLDQLDSMIDRPCQWTDCGRPIPESSPSNDFCSEVCERSWRAANVGGKFVRAMWAGYSLGETEVPRDHPAAPTHHGNAPALDGEGIGSAVRVGTSDGLGLFQIMSAVEGRPIETRRPRPSVYDYAAQVRRIAELYAVPPSMLIGSQGWNGGPVDWDAVRRELARDARTGRPLFDPLCAPLSVTALAGFLLDRVVTSPNMPDSVLVALPEGRDGETMVMRMWRLGPRHVHSACAHATDFTPSAPSSPNLEQVREELARYFRIPLEQVWMQDLDPQPLVRRVLNRVRRIID